MSMICPECGAVVECPGEEEEEEKIRVPVKIKLVTKHIKDIFTK